MIMKKNVFPQRLTKFLADRLNFLEENYGKESKEYQSIALQYFYSEKEELQNNEINEKHYEATLYDSETTNVERLYKRHCVIEINFNCLANCRYCLRSNYEKFVLKEDNMNSNVEYLKSIDAEEVLLTGGDPFLSLKKLAIFTDKIIEGVPTIKIIRIATRVFTQDPHYISEELLIFLKKLNERVRVEVATQINCAEELRDKSVIDTFRKIIKMGIPVYSQNVFLKGVNDTPEQLIDLYHNMRMVGIEAHYIFHSVPMRGTHHFRTSVNKFITCYEALLNSGQITGRSKPIPALMTSIGKITLTPFNLLGEIKSNGMQYVRVRSNYKYSERLSYNPQWKLPDEASIDEDGYIIVDYLDGVD